jgi:hypothetical protein
MTDVVVLAAPRGSCATAVWVALRVRALASRLSAGLDSAIVTLRV